MDKQGGGHGQLILEYLAITAKNTDRNILQMDNKSRKHQVISDLSDNRLKQERYSLIRASAGCVNGVYLQIQG